MRHWKNQFVGLSLLMATIPAAHATQTLIEGPVGSASFGTQIVLLPHGNYVVIDPLFDQVSPAVSDVGAVHLYRSDGVLISTFKGSTANDRIGSGGIVVLANGNFVVKSPNFNLGAASQAGAATLIHGSLGLNANASSINSLVGDGTGDQVGSTVIALDSGDYVVASPGWSNLGNDNVGAVTWGSGTLGVKGVVASTNSLIGSRVNDQVGQSIMALSGGRYVVVSPQWDNVTVADAGAVTQIGPGGLTGLIGAGSSMVGTIANSRVGGGGITLLPNGHYVVISNNWSTATATDAGAVTHVNPNNGPPRSRSRPAIP